MNKYEKQLEYEYLISEPQITEESNDKKKATAKNEIK